MKSRAALCIFLGAFFAALIFLATLAHPAECNVALNLAGRSQDLMRCLVERAK